MNLWTELSDQDFKVYEYIKFYNINRSIFYIPSVSHVAKELNKSERSISRSYARIKNKHLI
jgi:hypothetical protein